MKVNRWIWRTFLATVCLGFFVLVALIDKLIVRTPPIAYRSGADLASDIKSLPMLSAHDNFFHQANWIKYAAVARRMNVTGQPIVEQGLTEAFVAAPGRFRGLAEDEKAMALLRVGFISDSDCPVKTIFGRLSYIPIGFYSGPPYDPVQDYRRLLSHNAKREL